MNRTVGLVVATIWAGATVALVRRRSTRTLAALVALGVAAGVVALWWRLTVALIPAATFVGLIASVDGVLHGRARRGAAVVAAGVAATVVVIDPAPWMVLGIGLPVAVVLGVLMVAPALQRVQGVARQRLRWHLAGVCAATTLAAALLFGSWAFRWTFGVGSLMLIGSALVPIAMMAASTPLLRFHDRALTGAAAGAASAVVASAVALVPMAVLGRRPTQDERPFVVTLGLAAVVGAVAAPRLFRRTEGRLLRSLVGGRHEGESSLRTFSSRFSRSLPLEELLLQLCETLKATMSLTTVQIWTGADSVYELVASVPHRQAVPLVVDPKARDVASRTTSAGTQWLEVWIPSLVSGPGAQQCVVPLVRDGRLLGLIVAERLPRADPFHDRDIEALVDLARGVALAIHNAQLDTSLAQTLAELREQASDLRASRARLVAAADFERRRIERDLHDGAQQQLVALAVNLRTARTLLQTDPSSVDALLGELADEAITAAADVRNLAHGVYPPLLRESGLAAALRPNVGRMRQPISVDVPADRFAPDIEAALYFACLEGIQNAVKHADGADIAVVVSVADDTVSFEVADSGPGVDASHAPVGRGMDNVRDRIGAVGGRVTWSRRVGGGTSMSGSIPLAGS